jgi:flagellar protein FlbD
VILVTRLNGTIFYLNAELVRTIEPTPDTVITLINFEKIIVKEPAQTVVDRIIEYKRQVYCNLQMNKESEWI